MPWRAKSETGSERNWKFNSTVLKQTLAGCDDPGSAQVEKVSRPGRRALSGRFFLLAVIGHKVFDHHLAQFL